jgi:DNA adenine methylase
MEDYKPLRPFFCRIGTKRLLANTINKYIPIHNTYVEPFVGGGAILWSKQPSKKEVINDKDKSLIDDYKLLKSIKERTLPSRDILKSNESLNKFYNEASNTPMNKLTKSIILRCNTFGGTGKGKLYLKGNPLNKLNKLDEYQKRLKDVKIYNKSYEEIIKKYDSPNTFFYLDPPYEESEGLYKDPIIDYYEMRKLLDNVKGKWLLSINDSSFIRKTFKGYYYKVVKLASKGGTNVGLKPRTELLIMNYQP